MISRTQRLLCDSVQKTKASMYTFLKDNNQAKSKEGILPMIFRLPLRIDIQVEKRKRNFLSIESAFFVNLDSNQVQSLMMYAEERKLSLEKALIDLFQEIYSKDVMEIARTDWQFSKEVGKIGVKVGLWQEVKVTYEK